MNRGLPSAKALPEAMIIACGKRFYMGILARGRIPATCHAAGKRNSGAGERMALATRGRQHGFLIKKALGKHGSLR